VADRDARALEERWVRVLASVYAQVDWRRLRGRRRPLDVFEHRLEYAKYEADVPSVLQRLANSLSLQGFSADVDDIEYLRAREAEALEVLRRWTKLLALKASIEARKLKTARKAEREEGGGGA